MHTRYSLLDSIPIRLVYNVLPINLFNLIIYILSYNRFAVAVLVVFKLNNCDYGVVNRGFTVIVYIAGYGC